MLFTGLGGGLEVVNAGCGAIEVQIKARQALRKSIRLQQAAFLHHPSTHLMQPNLQLAVIAGFNLLFLYTVYGFMGAFSKDLNNEKDHAVMDLM